MKIIHFPEAQADLMDYGIAIPLLAQRYQQTLAHLLEHPTLGPQKEEWLRVIHPEPPTRADLERCHTSTYLDKLLGMDPFEVVADAYELRDSEAEPPYRYNPDKATLPLTDLVHKSLLQVSGTLETCREALRSGAAYFLGGGLHHAMSHAGRGFCLVHDVVLAIRKLQDENTVHTVWIIDVDAHRGDGTAELTLGDDSILTLSIHMAQGWPLAETPLQSDGHLKPWFYPGTVDIGIPCGQEKAYLELLTNGIRQLEVAAQGRLPDLVVVVDGSDPYELDALPSATLLKLTLEQMLARDHLIYDWCAFRRIPQAYVMAGGYGGENWRVHAEFLTSILMGQ